VVHALYLRRLGILRQLLGLWPTLLVDNDEGLGMTTSAEKFKPPWEAVEIENLVDGDPFDTIP
jgi:hypothetical protein